MEEELGKRNRTKKPLREVAEGAADVGEVAEAEARGKTIRTRNKITTTEITITDVDAGGAVAVEEDVGEITTTTGGET